MERNRRQGSELVTALEPQMIPCDLVATNRIAAWAYSLTQSSGGQVWRRGDDTMPLPVERWLMAATRCGTAAEKERLRQATREAMLQFTASNVDVDRPAIAALAIIDGKARFRDVR